jgi:UTP:GlnB (protein PII) uridylyltransferase
MSVFTDVVAEGQKIEHFLQNLVTGGVALQAEYGKLEPATLAAVSAVFYDVAKTVAAGTAAAGAAEAGNIPSAFTLSETTLGLVKQVVADVKAGKQVFVADFKALNITL